MTAVFFSDKFILFLCKHEIYLSLNKMSMVPPTPPYTHLLRRGGGVAGEVVTWLRLCLSGMTKGGKFAGVEGLRSQSSQCFSLSPAPSLSPSLKSKVK